VKVNFDLNNGNVKDKSKPSFGTYKFTKSANGHREFEASFPYDEDKYNCYLEMFAVDNDRDNNYFSVNRIKTKDNKELYQLSPGVNKIDLAKKFGISDDQPFAFHYVLENKQTKKRRPKVDAGDIIDERNRDNDYQNIFNIVMPNRSNVSQGGSMKLVIVDSQNVGWVYNKDNVPVYDEELASRHRNVVKTLANKYGGTLAGLEHAIDNGDYDSYRRIISLPVFTDDDFSAHAYWNKNCFQMVSTMGNINNYASLQRKMFAHGLNFVSDGAFVNEGLQGVHFKHLSKWGENSPYKYWFRAAGLDDGPLSYGVFVKNKEYISHKLVNPAKLYHRNKYGEYVGRRNPDYDKTKPTFIQFFDTRCVTDKQRLDNKNLITSYTEQEIKNPYIFHSHNDSVYPYAFEIRPEFYDKNIKQLNEFNIKNPDKLYLTIDSPMAARILSKSRFYKVDGKHEGGFETWNANPDIAKLNFAYSMSDTEALRNFHPDQREVQKGFIYRGNYQVQDYTIDSGKYWTAKTDDILRLFVAQNIKNADKKNPTLVYKNILSLADGKTFPKSLKTQISKEEVSNVLLGLYNHNRVLSNEDKKSQILEGLMNMPLDSVELGDNIVSVLASPLISKRACTKDDVGVPRYDLYKQGNKNLPLEYKRTYDMMDKIYTDEMLTFAQNVLDKVDNNMPKDKKIFDGDNVTEYGKYVLPLLVPEIAKYAVIKSFVPKAEVNVNPDSGEISYDYNALKNTHIQSLGINNPVSPEDEAEMLLESLRKGMTKLDSSFDSSIVQGLEKTLEKTSLESFKLADLIIDKTQAGLDWRIDATKDIADIESLLSNSSSFNEIWVTVIDFWKKFVGGVLSKNKNSYVVAEVTDENDLHSKGYGSFSKFQNYADILRKFKRETGITAIADYSNFFSVVSNIFGESFETGAVLGSDDYRQKILRDLFVGAKNRDPLVASGALDSLMYAYTFIGNHDKPRALHCLAMDMSLFMSDLTYPEGKDNRKKAFQILEDRFIGDISDEEVENYSFEGVSPKAIAMADAIRPALVNKLNEYKSNGRFKSEEEFNKKVFEPISKAVSDLAKGHFLGGQFTPEAFGVKPYDVAISMVIKQAKEVYGFELPPDLDAKYENEVFEAIMTPAIKKLLGMMKFLVALPGIPTLYDGDDAGASGYDTKTKNMFLQGRQKIHNEWFEDTSNEHYKKFIADYRKEFNDVMGLRKDPKLAALNSGGLFPLKLQIAQDGTKIPAMYRQTTDGRKAISLFNAANINPDHKSVYSPKTLYLDRIYLDEVFGSENTGIPGLKYDTKFLNANPDDKGEYYVKIDENGKHYITRVYGKKDVPTPITDTTLILYSVPDGVPLSFTGSCMVNPSAKFVSNAYSAKNIDCGKKLELAGV